MSDANASKTSKKISTHSILQNRSYWVWLFLIASAVLALGLSFLISTHHKYAIAVMWLKTPSLIVLNLLLPLLIVFFLYFLSGKAVFSALLVNIVWVLLSVADSIKVAMRQEPLLPTDLTLIQEVFTILKTFPTSRIVMIFGGIIIALILLVFAFFKSQKSHFSIKYRILGICSTIVIALAANGLFYSNTERYDKYPVMENPYFQVNQYNSRGLGYSFVHQANISHIKQPEGYSASAFDQIQEEHEPLSIEKEKLPHVVMIMGEAFSDLSENKNIHFDGYTDPMAHFRALTEKENAVSGHIVVPGYGGGTSNTEYDVLTSLPTRFLKTSLPSYSFIHHPMDALPHALSQIGYDTLSIHPGYAWFYNRQNVYPQMGFDTQHFLETDFDLQTQGKGGYVNEVVTMDKIIETLDKHIKESDNPLFSFTVTIQNHGPYDGKYGAQKQNFKSDVPLTDVESDLLTQYFLGIADGDAELARLVSYAEESEEPIILVYFGDHLPGFSNGMDFFDLLDYPIHPNGTPKEQLAVYETPFVLWANDSAAATCNFKENREKADLPKDGIISSHYLGALLVELMGLDGLSPLYDFNNELRKELPVLSNMYSVTKDGTYLEELSPEQEKKLSQLMQWQYYKLFDEKLSKDE